MRARINKPKRENVYTERRRRRGRSIKNFPSYLNCVCVYI